jgi:tagatose 1,6-diphosphate aldolase
MAKTMTTGKFNGLEALTRKCDGVLAVLANDQRGSLKKSLDKAFAENGRGAASDADFSTFKVTVAEELGGYASAVLADPVYGMPIIKNHKPETGGLLIAAEETGYQEAGEKGRVSRLLPDFSARRYKEELKADAVKLLVYYNPFASIEAINQQKEIVANVGEQCARQDILFLLEYVGYSIDPKYTEKSREYAKIKPDIVMGTMREFIKSKYKVDVHKIEFPFNVTYVEGTDSWERADRPEPVHGLSDVRKQFDDIRKIAGKCIVAFLSAAVDNPEFLESNRMAVVSGVVYNGVLCGRATWKEGIGIYAKEGEQGLRTWLRQEGVKRINALNAILKYAIPWYVNYGGKNKIKLNTVVQKV